MTGYIYKPQGDTFVKCNLKKGDKFLKSYIDVDLAIIGDAVTLYNLEDLTIEEWEIISLEDLKNER